MTAPAQDFTVDLASCADRIVEAFVPTEPLRPNDHLGSFFGFLQGSPSRSKYTEAGLLLECVFLQESWEAWFAFVSMRRRKSRPEDKTAYKSLYRQVESLSLSKQKHLASRVADKLSPQLKEAAERAWKGKGFKWRDQCNIIIRSGRAPQIIIDSWREFAGGETTASSSAPSTQAPTDDDVSMSHSSTAVDRAPDATQALTPVARSEDYPQIVGFSTNQAGSHKVFTPPWDAAMPPWLRYHMERKKLDDVTIYMAQPEWTAGTRELFARLFQATKPRPGTPGQRDVTVSAPQPSQHVDWATVCFALERDSLQAFAAGLFARVIKEDQGKLIAVSADGRENTPSEFDCLQCCSRSPQDLRQWLGDVPFAAVQGLSAWRSEEVSGEIFTKCVTLQWHSNPAMDSYLIVDVSNSHLDKFIPRDALFHQ